MKPILLLSMLFTSLLFVSCGDNTTTSPLHDISSIKINETNVSIYSTDTGKTLSATVFYDDNTSAQEATNLTWSSSDSTILYAYTNSIYPTKNGGDVTVTARYVGKFPSTIPVHVKELLSLTYSGDINVSDTSNPQTLMVYGNFENNETNVTMQGNITWSSDANMTISESNSSQVTFTIHSVPTTLTAHLFVNTSNYVDFNKNF